MYNLISPVSLTYFWKHIDQDSAMFNMTNESPGYRFVNKFRINKSKNTEIRILDNKLIFWDYGDSDFRCDIIELKVKLSRLSFTDAKNKLWEEFILSKRLSPSFPTIKYETVIKKRKEYVFCKRKWENYDTNYWSQYGITEQDCINGGLFPITYFYQRKEEESNIKLNSFDSPIYCWIINGYSKFYLPLVDKGEKRFISTLLPDDLYYNDDFSSNILFIGSSWKDVTVVKKKTGFAVRGVQGETCNVPKCLINDLSKFERVIISFDSDEEGYKANYRFYNILCKYHSNVECWYLNPKYKDYADYEKNNKFNFTWENHHT